ncbi:hypothetical protein SNEBB_010983 [Seison nebaliae]|nr:hypothetical protein SNEBB_010983 [Seison nebaliae]
MNVVVRFAPSPTGSLHLGSLRTALCNYIYAKTFNGKFILRIEDTDQKRIVRNGVNEIREKLADYSLRYDEEMIQSTRLDIYQKYGNRLIDKGFAYRCFCLEKHEERCPCRYMSDNMVAERLSSNDNFTVKFFLNHLQVNEIDSFPDYQFCYEEESSPKIYRHEIGKIEKDFILIKSDSFPTYHLANVVDDHLSRISHVIRGNEWKTSTIKHLRLYRALNWSPPKFIHLPLLMESRTDEISSKKIERKLSKRNSNEMNLEDFEKSAILQFLLEDGETTRNLKYKNLKILIEEFVKKRKKKKNNHRRLRFDLLKGINRLHLMERMKNDQFSQMMLEEKIVWKSKDLEEFRKKLNNNNYLDRLDVKDLEYFDLKSINRLIHLFSLFNDERINYQKFLSLIQKEERIHFFRIIRLLTTGDMKGLPINLIFFYFSSYELIERLNNFKLTFSLK